MLTLNGIEYREKDVFRKVIIQEAGPSKPVLCKFAQEFLDNVIPSYFWTESASVSCKYHPSFALNDGGLARHSLMAYRWLKSILETQTETALKSIKDVIPSMSIAALFHDCCKRGLPGSEDFTKTAFEHPLFAAKLIVEKADEFVKNNKEFIDKTADDEESFKQDIAILVSCIETHMGRWNKSDKSNIELPMPRTNLQYMVHLADFCSSRRFTVFDEEYFANMMKED